MNLIAEFHRRIALSRKQKEAKALRHEIWEIKDWQTQAARVLAKKEEALRRLDAQIGALESPDDIVRRAGAGA